MDGAATLSKTPSSVFPEELWEGVGSLPAVISVDLRARRFTLRDLLLLEAGTVLETDDRADEQVPVLVNGKQIGWAKFEVLGHSLGLRIMDLA